MVRKNILMKGRVKRFFNPLGLKKMRRKFREIVVLDILIFFTSTFSWSIKHEKNNYKFSPRFSFILIFFPSNFPRFKWIISKFAEHAVWFNNY